MKKQNNQPKIIYIFGNPLLPEDSLPLRLVPDLRKALPEIDFVVADPIENLKPQNKELIIIDTILGIKNIVVINNINKIQLSPLYSAHDLDLGFNLKLLAKLGQLQKITIFGLPPNFPPKKALKRLIPQIKALV